jgi:hypothetical protein
LIDGEAIVCDENGLAVFELIRRHGALASAVLCAFVVEDHHEHQSHRRPSFQIEAVSLPEEGYPEAKRKRDQDAYSAAFIKSAVMSWNVAMVSRYRASLTAHIPQP